MQSWGLELARPWWLAGLAVLPMLVWYFRRSLVDFPRRQRLASLILRSLLVVLLVLALAGLTLLAPTSRQFVVFVHDESSSIGHEARQAVRRFIDEARRHSGGHASAVLGFATEPGKLRNDFDEESQDVDPLQRRALSPAAQGSNLAAAIDVAAASIPPAHVPKIVLLSDGNETEGNALLSATVAAVPISTVPLPARGEPEVQVSSVSVPAQVRQGEPFYAEVVIDSNHDDEGFVELFRGSLKLASDEPRKQKVVRGENRFRFRQTIDAERLVQFTVRIDGFQDTLLDNNEAAGLVFTSGRPRVLLVDSEPRTARDLVWALKEQEILVEVRPAAGLPDDLAGLQGFEALMISNVPASALSPRQMEVVRAYVEDLGGGLIMLGGDQSFGLGGYYKTAMEEILPVRSDFEKEQDKPSLAMVLAIDKSGSMGGQKIQLAKEAARSAVELLSPRDQIGIVAFDGESYWVSEIHPASDSAAIAERISTIQASGGTSMYPAMEMASDALASSVAKLKHVILLTDGISSPGDFEGAASKMASNRITLSTVGIGHGAHQEVLERIARLAGGRYYFCNEPQAVPQIFAKETVTASKSAIHEEPFLPQLMRPTPVLSEIDFEAAPFLLGYVVTRAKPTSELILASEKGEPILAWWRYGLGMCAAFTSDAKNRWAAEWTTWPDFGKFWAQVVRHVMRKNETNGAVVDIRRQGSQVDVLLDAVDAHGQFINQADTSLTVLDPQLQRQQMAMSQVAPGRYKATFAAPQSGTYHLELAQHSAGQQTFHQTRGLVVGYADELRLRPTNQPLLTKIAEVSGGRYAADAKSIFLPDGRTAPRAEPLWPYLLSAVALLFVLDVALRRIDFSRFRPLWRPRMGALASVLPSR